MRNDFKLSEFEPMRLRRASKVLKENLSRLSPYETVSSKEAHCDERKKKEKKYVSNLFGRLKRFFAAFVGNRF